MPKALQEEAKEMAAAWTGRIPVVPEKLSFEDFTAKASVQEALQDGQLPLGLDTVEVKSVGITLKQLTHMLVMSDNEENLSFTFKSLIIVSNALSSQTIKTLLLDMDDTLEEYQQKVNTYLSDKETILKLDMSRKSRYKVKRIRSSFKF